MSDTNNTRVTGGVTGSGIICTLTFSTQSGVNGTCCITPCNVTLADVDGYPMPIVVSAGNVTIGSEEKSQSNSPPSAQLSAKPSKSTLIPINSGMTMTELTGTQIVFSGGDEVAGIASAAACPFESATGVQVTVNQTSDTQGMDDLNNDNCDVAGSSIFSGTLPTPPPPPPVQHATVGAFWVGNYTHHEMGMDDLPNDHDITYILQTQWELVVAR